MTPLAHQQQTDLNEELRLANEALNALNCPYFLASNTNLPPREGKYGRGTCDGGCHEEPRCMVDTPPGGWAQQLLDAACKIFIEVRDV